MHFACAPGSSDMSHASAAMNEWLEKDERRANTSQPYHECCNSVSSTSG